MLLHHRANLGLHLVQVLHHLQKGLGSGLCSLLQVFLEVHCHLVVLWVLVDLWVLMDPAEMNHKDLVDLEDPFPLEDPGNLVDPPDPDLWCPCLPSLL